MNSLVTIFSSDTESYNIVDSVDVPNSYHSKYLNPKKYGWVFKSDIKVKVNDSDLLDSYPVFIDKDTIYTPYVLKDELVDAILNKIRENYIFLEEKDKYSAVNIDHSSYSNGYALEISRYYDTYSDRQSEVYNLVPEGTVWNTLYDLYDHLYHNTHDRAIYNGGLLVLNNTYVLTTIYEYEYYSENNQYGLGYRFRPLKFRCKNNLNSIRAIVYKNKDYIIDTISDVLKERVSKNISFV